MAWTNCARGWRHEPLTARTPGCRGARIGRAASTCPRPQRTDSGTGRADPGRRPRRTGGHHQSAQAPALASSLRAGGLALPCGRPDLAVATDAESAYPNGRHAPRRHGARGRIHARSRPDGRAGKGFQRGASARAGSDARRTCPRHSASRRHGSGAPLACGTARQTSRCRARAFAGESCTRVCPSGTTARAGSSASRHDTCLPRRGGNGRVRPQRSSSTGGHGATAGTVGGIRIRHRPRIKGTGRATATVSRSGATGRTTAGTVRASQSCSSRQWCRPHPVRK